jgi:hypothetical protein
MQKKLHCRPLHSSAFNISLRFATRGVKRTENGIGCVFEESVKAHGSRGGAAGSGDTVNAQNKVAALMNTELR